MKLCNPEELKSMIEKEMAGKFGASRTTCREARAILLSVNAGRY